MSDFFQNQLLENATGMTAKGIKAAKLKLVLVLVLVPGISEQMIVAEKINSFMRLCNHLEQQLTMAYGDAEKLIDATIKRLAA